MSRFFLALLFLASLAYISYAEADIEMLEVEPDEDDEEKSYKEYVTFGSSSKDWIDEETGEKTPYKYIMYEEGPNGELLFGDDQSDEFKLYVKTFEKDERAREIMRNYQNARDLDEMQMYHGLLRDRRIELEEEMIKNGTMTRREINEEDIGKKFTPEQMAAREKQIADYMRQEL